MGEAIVIRHIGAWEAAGLIDEATAARLREAEAAEGTQARPEVTGLEGPARSSGIDLRVGVAELFGYLGAFFVLLAWHAATLANQPAFDVEGYLAVTAFVPALALGLGGMAAARGPARLARAAGWAMLAGLPYVAAGTYFLVLAVAGEPIADSRTLVLATAAMLLVAAIDRWWLAATTTQLGLALSIVAVGFATWQWFGERAGGVTSPAEILASVGWWILVAALVGVLARFESRSSRPGAGVRATLSRSIAATTAVLGTALVVIMANPREYPDWEYVLEPIVAALVLLAVSGALVGLALWRGAMSYLWPAALGIVIALTWLNAEYLSDEGLGAAFMAEAVILFGVAGATAALQRRLRRADDRRADPLAA